MFNASYFTYDGKFSGEYGLQIASFDSSNQETTSVFAPELTTVKSSLSRTFHHAGIKYESPPTFDFQIISETPISNFRRRDILLWLTGRNSFKPLVIDQIDLEDYTYNVVFTIVDLIYFRGHCHGFEVTATFDSWFCHGKQTTLTLTGTGSTVEGRIINKSDTPDDYVYPSIELVSTDSYGTDDDDNALCCTLINTTDSSSRESVFYNLSANETVTLDGETRAIYNSNGLGRLAYFNKNWLRLSKGVNKISATLNGTVKITCPNYVLIGF